MTHRLSLAAILALAIGVIAAMPAPIPTGRICSACRPTARCSATTPRCRSTTTSRLALPPQPAGQFAMWNPRVHCPEGATHAP